MRRKSAVLLALAAVGLASLAVFAAAQPAPSSGWVTIEYGELVDGRALSHSGEPVAEILRALGGRPVPAGDERREDRLHHALLEPLLEPFAFVLADAIDASGPAPERPWIEVGALWHEGERQPAWVELLRARALVVESDGLGRLRVFAPLPAAEGGASSPPDSEEASRRAFEHAWPVLRHVLAAERRRLTPAAGPAPVLDVEARAFVHEPERTRFRLATTAARMRVDSTAPKGSRPPLDLAALAAFLERGLQIEGGRIEPSGELKLFGSEAATRPTLLGRPIDLTDLAIAYRAVFHGGLAEPYMSLDKGRAPQIATVNYGGRLRDTALGYVSLLCDIRFKTFSLGIDALGDQDVRERLRAEVPEFKSHLERLSADPRSKGIGGQQTRLWFYPDRVDLTLSEEADAMLIRRARMAASSERVSEGAAAREDPPWTVDTVGAINRDYERLARFFPELGELDHAARLLSTFAWLKAAEQDGLVLPDLDSLLAVELPSIPTPREYPQLLALNALPPSGQGPVDVFSRFAVEEALDRLLPEGSQALPAELRFERARAGLDRTLPDHAALAAELDKTDPRSLTPDRLDLLSYRAERLRMHRLVLGTLPAEAREKLSKREPGLRVFSVGIGGLDLGMGASVARGRSKGRRKIEGASFWSGGGARAASAAHGEAPRTAAATIASPGGPVAESRGIPETVVPPHGANAQASSSARAWLSSGKSEGASPGTYQLVVYRKDAPDVESRKAIHDSAKKLVVLERFEQGRFLRYRLGADGATLRAKFEAQAAPARATTPASAVPADLAILELADPPAGASPTLPVRLRSQDAGDRSADLPRAAFERAVLGREVDLDRAQPLAALSPAPAFLGAAQHLLVQQRPAEAAAPWDGNSRALPGEQLASRVAAGLTGWWSAEADPRSAAVGTDPKLSASRWESAPRPKDLVLWVPKGTIPGPFADLANTLASGARAGKLVSDPAGAARGAALVVLVSAEPAGVVADRLRRAAEDPAFRGKLLAVYPLAGALRADLPASLLAAGNLAGVGVAEPRLAGIGRIALGIDRLAAAIADPKRAGRRVEDFPGPFVWYF